jgi:hypothetical protein
MPPDNDINEATVFVELSCSCQVGGMPSGISYVSRLSMKRLQVYEEQRRYNIEVSGLARVKPVDSYQFN